ncbi:uroplakin-3b-like isoform X2 [Crotalus tigris]|uniref:uroplakin-3b-like isoform X2 n=1 Tax=Crotalus tigris TaxID=88082 RepID=UPI00192FA340|nr:uroplakin-3b-like isoform X2 [Crotalus tigris]
MQLYGVKLGLLLFFAGSLRSGWTIPLENLEKIPLDFSYDNTMLLTTLLGTNFIINIPKCVSSSKFTSATVRIAVAQLPDASTLPGVTDTEQIENIRRTPQAQVYFADEFKSTSCRMTRDLLVLDLDDSQYELITVIGYQVGTELCRQTKGPFCNQPLKPSTFYRVNYFFLDEKSVIRAHTDWSTAIQTRNVTNYESADIMFEGRAGGMIVITILVSVGGAVLLIALIVAAVLSNKK